ncbi:MAG: hypothetical protein HY735_26160 [Verrucomicrobia bacterium]|nr:hypothetical protein [Verrucomicrobiota bacterium]
MKSPLNLATLAFFSPDGNTLVVANRSGAAPNPFVQLLRAESLAQIDAAMHQR